MRRSIIFRATRRGAAASAASAPKGEGPTAAAAPLPHSRALIDGLLAAIGGSQNVREVDPVSSRLRIAVADASRVDTGALQRLGLRGSELTLSVPRHDPLPG